MGEQGLVLRADLPKAPAFECVGIVRWFDPQVPFQAVGQRRATEIAGTDEGSTPDRLALAALHADIRLEVKALLLGLEHPDLGAALRQQHQPSQGRGIGDVEIVASQHAQVRAARLDCID